MTDGNVRHLPGLERDGELAPERCLHHPGVGVCGLCLPELIAAALVDADRRRPRPAASAAGLPVPVTVEEREALGVPVSVTVDGAAGLLGISASKTWELIAAGEVPSLMLGGRRLVPFRELQEVVSRVAARQAAARDRDRPP